MADTDVIVERNQRREFGGFNFGSAFFGWLVATGMAALLTALLSAAGGAVALTTGTNAIQDNASTVGLISGILLLLALAVSYYCGGYVAGRMSRFDGGRQGLGVWMIGLIITVALAAIGAVFGSSYNLLQQLNLPHIPVNAESLTTGGLITLLLGIGVTLLSAMVGGKAGERYHRRIDRIGYRGAEKESRLAELEDRYEEEKKLGGRRPMPSFGERIDRHRDRDSRRR